MRERHRRAIIDAAGSLLDERGAAGFTVDELADKADVSRRTVFNHFPSVDDIVIAACSEVLGRVLGTFESLASAHDGPGRQLSLFDEVADALTSTDLVPPMAYLTRVLGGDHSEPSPRQAAMLLRVFTETSDDLTRTLLRRHPDADGLTTHLLVGALMSGLVILHERWFTITGGADDAASREVWADLLRQLVDLTRDGYGTVASTGTTPEPHSTLPRRERHG